MSETSVKIDTLLADVAAFFVSKYGMSPRDAVGLVMQSDVAEALRRDGSSLRDMSVERLAAEMM